jgi:hypothetical protein
MSCGASSISSGPIQTVPAIFLLQMTHWKFGGKGPEINSRAKGGGRGREKKGRENGHLVGEVCLG